MKKFHNEEISQLLTIRNSLETKAEGTIQDDQEGWNLHFKTLTENSFNEIGFKEASRVQYVANTAVIVKSNGDIGPSEVLIDVCVMGL